jgi:hypothetical protein
MNIDAEIKWAKEFLNLDPWEMWYFEKHLIDLNIMHPDLPIAKESGLYPDPGIFPEMDKEDMILLIAVYRIFYARLISYAHYFVPTDKYNRLISTKTNQLENKNVPDEIGILNSTIIRKEDQLIGDFLSKANKDFVKLFYMIDNADEITIKLKDDQIVLIRISTKALGTYLINDFHLQILYDLRNAGNEFLTEIKDSKFLKQSEFEELKKVFLPFFNAKKKLVFGHEKNSMKEDFVLSLYPLFRCIDERFREQSSTKFKSYTKRDIYRFIIKLLEIPESILSEYDLEQYFKDKFRIKNKPPDSELPF